MNKKDLERRLEAAEKQNLGLLDEIKELKVQLAEMQDEPEIPDKPYFRSAEQYWYVESEGSLVNNVSSGGVRSDFNNFHTEAYAQEFANKCKLIAMMLHCKWYADRGYVENWDDVGEEKWKYFVYYSRKIKAFKVDSTLWYDDNNVYFSTEENAQKCADWINRHWRDNEK